MARLPSDADLGGIGNPSSGRPIANVDVTGYARGAAALGSGISDLGKGIAVGAREIASTILENNKETDTLEEARANSNYLIKTKQIRDEYSTASDANGLEEKYKPQLQQAYDESASMITNPKKRELWSLKTAPNLEENNLAVGSKVYDLQKTKAVADTYDRLDQIRSAAISEADPTKRSEFIATGQGLIRGLKDAGYIDDIGEQKLRKGWTQNYAIAAIEAMPPEERVKTLSTSVQSKDQILDRFKVVEGSGKNPNSSAQYDFQFTNKTWLDTIQAHRPDLLQGRNPKDVLALRADSKLAREMAGYLLDDNSAILRSQGVTPTPTNLYLAHFLGAGDAAKVARAAPGTPISDIVQPESIAANKSVLEGKTAGTVIDWAGSKMGSANGRSSLQFDNYNLPPKEANLIEYHRDNLRNGTYLDKGGDISTVYITGISGPGGKEYNVPGYWDGKIHTDQKEIADHAASIGWDKFPSYATPQQADFAAKRIHEIVDTDTQKFREQKQQRKGGLVDFIPEDKRLEMLHTANQEVAGGLIDGERRSKLEQQKIKDTSDVAENEIVKDLWSDNPKMTVQSIARDDRLTVAAKERMISAAQRALADSKSDKTYGPAFMNIYQRIHLPDGAPEKITDPSMLYPMVGQKDGLTVQGVDKLVSEINARRTPEGVAEAEMKKQFLMTAKSQISGSDEGLHIKDPKGDELYLKFLANALPAYEEGKKAGKTPAQLLNPDSPDYVGKAITNYKRPMNQWFNDVVNGGGLAATTTAPATFDVKQVKTLDELMAAYRSGKVSRADAGALAIEKGWATAAPTPSLVPVSQ